MACSSRSPPARCAPLPPTLSTWEPESGQRWCCIPGARRSPTIRTCTESCPAAGWPPTPIDGSVRKPGFFLPVRVLSRLFRRLFLEQLELAHRGGQLRFFGQYADPADPGMFAQWLVPLHKTEWVVYAKRPFAGPQAVLAYLSRYTHRVAISNRRLLAFDEHGVTFRWKDYRAKGRTRYKTMTLAAEEFMRRFLLHVLPGGFHRIRHYGLLANATRKENLAVARELLHQPLPQATPAEETTACGSAPPLFVCRHCGSAMTIVETFARPHRIRAPPVQPGAP